MAINLSRNTKVYFTTRTHLFNGVPNSPTDSATYTSADLFEISVQDGYSLGQATQEQTISVNEAGNNAVRGSRSFNTQLDPVDFSFSSYIRPVLSGTNRVEAAERLLWNALFGAAPISTTSLAITTQPTRTATTGTAAAVATVVFTGTTGAAASLAAGTIVNFQNATGAQGAEWNQPARITAAPVFSTNTTCTIEFMKAPSTAAGLAATAAVAYTGQWAQSDTAGSRYSYVSTMASNQNQLQGFGMIFVIDNVVYAVDNCVMDSATVDFGLDQISMVQWAGKGARIRTLTTPGLAAHLATSATPAPTNANYITNKLSTLTLASNIGGAKTTDSQTYSIAITGGQLTISNNVTYLTPSNLGVVNSAITYFTGARSISGNVTAYLRTGEGASSSGALYDSLLAGAVNTTEPKFYAQLEMGGGSNATRVDFEMPGIKLQIPTVDVQDIVSTTINFMAQPHNPNYTGLAGAAGTFDLTKSNELLVKYYSA